MSVAMPHHQRLKRIIGLGLILGLLLPGRVQSAEASLALSPASDQVREGETFSLRLVVNTGGQAINAAEATVSFRPELLEVKQVSKAGSIFSLWPNDPTFSNSRGTISFSGGVPNPGFIGSAGRIVTVTFLAQRSGKVTLAITGAQVLANDGQGTNIFGSASGATVTILEKAEPAPAGPTLPAPSIASSTHPDPGAWSVQRDVSATWSAGSEVTGYNAEFDQSPTTVPAEASEGLGSALSRTGLPDGVWYLHIRAQYRQGWSGTSHYAFRIDTAPPSPFTLTVEHTPDSSPDATVAFTTTDATSGINRYELRLDDGSFAAATSPAKLTGLGVGDHRVTVKAIDQAGNVTEAGATVTVTEAVSLRVSLDVLEVRAEKGKPAKPTIVKGKPLRLQGLAKLDETVRIVVRSEESVFEFPVSEIIDPNPVEPAPPGYGAWKVELKPDLAPGEHTINVSTKDAEGNITAQGPTITFQVVTDVVQIGNSLISYRLVLIALGIAVVILLGLVVLLLLIVRRLRQRHAAAGGHERPGRHPSAAGS